jgi:hypothetical protein
MTDLTLRRSGASADTGLAAFVLLLKEAFAATPLGLMLAAFRSR